MIHDGHSGREPAFRAIDELCLPGRVRRLRCLPVSVGKLPARLIHSGLGGALLRSLRLVSVQARLLVATVIEALRLARLQPLAVNITTLV